MDNHISPKIPNILLLALLSAFLSACASGQSISATDIDSLAPEGELGQLVIYRTNILGAEITPKISLNGELLSNGETNAICISNGASFVNLPAGKHTLSMKTEVTREHTVEVKPRSRSFVECSVSGLGLILWRPRFETVDPIEGEEVVFRSGKIRLTGTYHIN